MSLPATLGNKLDSVRRHNLSIVIRIVHRRGPQSRSALTHTTRLNRSTIGALVAELVELGLATEAVPESNTRVGRPSPVVAANQSVVAATVNPEVDAITVALVGLGGAVHGRVRYPTDAPARPEEAARIAAAVLNDLRAARPSAAAPPVAVGAAIPGLVRRADGVVRLAPHLHWVDAPFQQLLTEATGLPARTANDASLGAHAEHLFGAGRGVADLVYLNGGAGGIGCGVVSRGELLAGAAGYAGELGHTLVNSVGTRCSCGAVGCLETEVRQDALLALLGMDSGALVDPADIGPALAASTDVHVRRAIHTQLEFLAVALRNVVNLFNPRLVVLGGFLASLHYAAHGVLERLVRAHSLAAPAEGVRIVPAALGADLLAIGAAELAFERLLADPAAFGR